MDASKVMEMRGIENKNEMSMLKYVIEFEIYQ